MAVVAVRLGVAGGGELDDSGAPVTQWIEDAAMHRAQAVRTGDDDWEMKLGDGARAKRREAGAGDGGDGGVSPRFQMNSMESIMSHAKQVPGKHLLCFRGDMWHGGRDGPPRVHAALTHDEEWDSAPNFRR
eukprot:COSAG01_NODE_2661_length_7295_cov_10.017371_3_plen_131_part_00